MRNLRGDIFYMMMNVLEDFYICMSVPLTFHFVEALVVYLFFHVQNQWTCK